MIRLIERPSIVPLLLFKHVVINNLQKLLSGGNNCYIILEVLLSQVSGLFEHRALNYFMRNYDWNYLETPVCQDTLRILYEYT